jgi:molybdopterin synthase sulfur carrier subunit
MMVDHPGPGGYALGDDASGDRSEPKMGKMERPHIGAGGDAGLPVGRVITVLYFASVREGIGIGRETVHPPAAVTTLGQFVEWLRQRGPAHHAALAPGLRIRAAVDRLHADPATPIAGANEIAIFPMMTGG